MRARARAHARTHTHTHTHTWKERERGRGVYPCTDPYMIRNDVIKFKQLTTVLHLS